MNTLREQLLAWAVFAAAVFGAVTVEEVRATDVQSGRVAVTTPMVQGGEEYAFVRVTMPNGHVRKWTDVTNYSETEGDATVELHFTGKDDGGNAVVVSISLPPGGIIEKKP